MIPKRMLRVVLVAAFLCTTVHATEWLALPLHRRIELSDTIVVARVVDPAKALVSVERVFKVSRLGKSDWSATSTGSNAPVSGRLCGGTHESCCFSSRQMMYTLHSKLSMVVSPSREIA